MHPLLDIVNAINAIGSWLLAANVALLAVLCLLILRYRQLHVAARAAEQRNAALIENLHEGVYRSTFDGKLISANLSLVRMNGYDTEGELLGAINDVARDWYVDPKRRDEFTAALNENGKIENFVSQIYRHRTGEAIWVAESARIVCDAYSRPSFYEGSVREVTESMRRYQFEQQVRKLTDQLPGGLFQFVREENGDYRIAYLSSSFRRVVGLGEELSLDTASAFVDLLVPEFRRAYFKSLAQSRKRLVPWDYEFRLRTPAGEEKWMRIAARPEAEDGTITWHGYLSDISLSRRQAIRIEKLAYFDPLTNLPNRRLLLDRMANAVNAARKGNAHGTLLFIDLDNFKFLNDSQGHHVGDNYLTQVANRLEGCVRGKTTVARIGGDEFVVMIEDIGADHRQSAIHAAAAANRILETLRCGFDLGQVHHFGSASIGVVVFDGQEAGVDELLKRADIAMYQAKAAGRNAMVLFDPACLEEESLRFRLIGDLRTAIARRDLEFHFQPQIDRENLVCGAELLLRWKHDDLGEIAPSRFLPLAEQSGLICDIDTLVVEKGARTLASWAKDASLSRLRLALNISTQSLLSARFVADVKRFTQLYRLDASLLTFELTESAMAKDRSLVGCHMHELKKLGIRFSLDDFGTGNSSLAFLKAMPFDEVKIDGSFVADIETHESDRSLIRSILAVSATLGLVAIAEHVENEKQRIFLQLFGCNVFQGFLYSPACPEEAFLAYLRQRAPDALSDDTVGMRQKA